MSQAHGSTLWTEPAQSGATPSVITAVFVLVSTGIYELRTTGRLAASLVSDGAGGYDLSDTDLTGTGGIAVFGAAPTIGAIY